MTAESVFVALGICMTVMGLGSFAVSSSRMQAATVPGRNRRQVAITRGLAEPKA